MTDHDRPDVRRGWVNRLRRRVQDRLWTRDEEWAIERGYRSRRSASGWSITVRDPRWDTRSACGPCSGTGRAIDGTDCRECDGAGVVVETGHTGSERSEGDVR